MSRGDLSSLIWFLFSLFEDACWVFFYGVGGGWDGGGKGGNGRADVSGAISGA